MKENESEWLDGAIEGDDDAFAQLVELYQKPVYNLCYRMLGTPGDAEDAAQEAFLRAYKNLRRYDRNRSFATWLLSIASHYCIDQLRKRHAYRQIFKKAFDRRQFLEVLLAHEGSI